MRQGFIFWGVMQFAFAREPMSEEGIKEVKEVREVRDSEHVH